MSKIETNHDQFVALGDLAQCHWLDEFGTINQIEDAGQMYVHAILTLQTDA